MAADLASGDLGVKVILKDNLKIADGVVCNLVDIDLEGSIELRGETSALVMKRTTVSHHTPISCSGNFGAIDLSDGCSLANCTIGLKLNAPADAPQVNAIVSIRDTSFAFKRMTETNNRFISCQNGNLQTEDGVIYLEGCTFNGTRVTDSGSDDFQQLLPYFDASESGITFSVR